LNFPEPEIRGTTYIYTFSDEMLVVVLSRLKDKGSTITAEVEVRTTDPNYNPFLLRETVNLLAPRTKTEIANALAKAYRRQVDFQNLIKYVAAKTIDVYRKGEDVHEIVGGDVHEERKSYPYLIEPLIYRNLPNIIYGEGGSAKSTLGLGCCVLVGCNYTDNPMKLKVNAQATPLYLDYELENDLTQDRLDMIVNGFGLPPFKMKYRRCGLPLVEDFNRIEKVIAENKIDFVVIDSLATAAGSDNLKDAQAATDFYNALRQLRVTSLIIAHPSKGDSINGKNSSIYGSVFFFNLARNVWECKLAPEAEGSEIEIALRHSKNNLGKLHNPLAFKIEFTDNTIEIMHTDVKKSFFQMIPLALQILDTLKAHGMMAPKDVADELGAQENSVRSILSRLHKQGKVICLNREYGVAANEG